MQKLTAIALTAILWMGTSALYAQESSAKMAHRVPSVSAPSQGASQLPAPHRVIPAFAPLVSQTSNEQAEPSTTNDTRSQVTQLLVNAFFDSRNTTIKKAVVQPKRVISGYSRTNSAPPPGVGRKIQVTAFAYCLNGYTASGTPTDIGTIAVDPHVIPMGSRIYVPGYGWGRALDTGGSVRGHAIDLWLPRMSDCTKWGVRTTTITILP